MTFQIRIRDDKIVQKIIEIQDKLSTIPCVDPFPKDYLHITVKGCGFPVESAVHEDDILTANLPRIVSQAEEVLQRFRRFKVFLPKLNIFSEVVVVEVHDEGQIRELNRELQAIPQIQKRKKFDYPNLLPHISIAQFQNNQEFGKLVSYLEELRDIEFGELTVNYIDLVSAHLSEKYPTLKTIQAFRLK